MATSTVAGKASRAAGNHISRRLTPREAELYERIPQEMQCMYDPSFAAAGADERFFGRDAATIDVPGWVHFPQVRREVVQVPASRARLSASDERELFLQYNYARFRLGELIEAQGRRAAVGRARRMVRWYDRVLRWRAKIVRANMALVVAMARRTRITGVEFAELISEGNMALLRSVEKFDVARGFKFSTYACRAILKGFNRMATRTGKRRQRFPTEYDPDLDRSDWDVHRHEMQTADSVEAIRDILTSDDASLSDLERTVVVERFAIVAGGRGKTLAEVGGIVGLTNERVRQIQNIALGKLRTILDEQYLVA